MSITIYKSYDFLTFRVRSKNLFCTYRFPFSSGYCTYSFRNVILRLSNTTKNTYRSFNTSNDLKRQVQGYEFNLYYFGY